MSIDIFKEMEESNTEQIIFNYNKASGLKSIIVINDTTLGPAMGGCRMLDYETTDDALMDAIRLAVGMTYKSAIAGTNYGGGKTVILGDPKTEKTEIMFRDLGRFVQTLNGRYYMGTDVGTSFNDMENALQESAFIVGTSENYGGYGDSAVPTAYGVYMAMKAAAKFKFGNDSLKDLTIAIQGVGAVGSALVEYLVKEDANILISDRTGKNAEILTEKFPKIKVVDKNDIYEQECDIFAPCALGSIINDETIPKLKCKIIAGSANNQLKEPRHGKEIHDKGILFAPDFVINVGGLISASDTLDMGGVNQDRVLAKTGKIYDKILEIFKRSEEEDITTTEIANKMAEEYIDLISQIKRKYTNY